MPVWYSHWFWCPVHCSGVMQWQGRMQGDHESNFIHCDFLQFGKQHSWHMVILSSSVLSQQCCEVLGLVHPSCSSEAVMRFFYQILQKPPPPTLLAGPAPVQWWACSSLSAHLPADEWLQTLRAVVLMLIFVA